MAHFEPRDKDEHRLACAGYDKPDYCLNCNQPFMDHTNGECPPDRAEPDPDYLAIITFQYGCGSYGRAKTAHEAVENCRRIAQADWGPMLKEPEIMAKVGVYEITGHDDVFWDDQGVHPNDDPKITFPLLRVDEVTLKRSRQRKRR